MKKKDKKPDKYALSKEQKERILKEERLIKQGKKPPFLNEELIFD